MPDKYSAVWTSHTSISDFLACPKAYYLKHVYRDPKTNHKIKLMAPPLALGQSVHEVLESLSQLPKEKRFQESLMTKLDAVWEKVRGKRGGFASDDVEYGYKVRAQDMLRRVIKNPGPIGRAAVKIQTELPFFWLSEEENIILCGKIDWLEYLADDDTVHIIDFKTGKHEEDAASLQLPIYHLLVANCQKRKVSKASYWYLDHDDDLTPKALPALEAAKEKVLAVARDMKLARQLQRFVCKEKEGCWSCRPFTSILDRKAEYIGTDEFNYDVYILPQVERMEVMESVIL